MIVVGIMGLIATMGVPIVYKMYHKQPMYQTVVDVLEVCKNARARAILQGTMTEVVFHPLEGRLEVGGTGGEAPMGMAAHVSSPGVSGSGLSAVISEHIVVEMLDINLVEYKDAEIARMRFYPNGMSDELTIVLRSEHNEWRKITSELTTGLVSVEDFKW